MSLSQILTPSIQKAIQALFDVTVEKIEFQTTRKEFEGDITMVIFPLLKVIKSNPAELGNKIGTYLVENISEVARFNVVSGFLNIVISDQYYLDFFNEINIINKKDTGEYYAHNTIAKENKLFRALLNCANEDEIIIGFNYNKKEYFINRREIKNEVFLTQYHLATIINSDTSHSKEFTHAKNYILLSSFTGLRIGDVIYLHEIKPIKLIHNSKKYDCKNHPSQPTGGYPY